MEQTCRIMTVATISCNTSLLKPQDLKYDTFILAVKYTQLNSSFCRLCYRKCQCFGTIHFFGIIVAHHETPIQLCAKREVGVVRSQYPVYPSTAMLQIRNFWRILVFFQFSPPFFQIVFFVDVAPHFSRLVWKNWRKWPLSPFTEFEKLSLPARKTENRSVRPPFPDLPTLLLLAGCGCRRGCYATQLSE